MNFLPIIRVTAKGRRWWQTGHPWIYRNDLVPGETAAPGDLVKVVDHQGRFLGQAFYSGASRIALRMVSREELDINRGWWENCFRRALSYRTKIIGDAEAFRLIYAETDGFPGLIVDSYSGHLAVQVHHPGMERYLSDLLDIFQEILTPPSITLRNDSEVRRLEGLPLQVETVAGVLPERLQVVEGRRRFWVDIRQGHKTGLFLDQRENRLAAATWASGEVLDCFTYQGGFAIHLAAGAAHVTAVESSGPALDEARKNAGLNAIDNITWIQQNCFNFLKEAVTAEKKYDVIILDPPAFAKRREDREAAYKGYREINRRALQLLQPGGILITCSCSYNLAEMDFLELVREAAAATHRQVRLIERRSAARDHPALLTLPESIYLKCFFLWVD
jgi:23S rRNA (cytosine1962-C5)-methyltransferase